ncbi:DUF5304 family protein [Streptomyces sp. M19]
MSDATERPAEEPADDDPAADRGPGPEPESDAWERACAEDLAAERERRRARYGRRAGPGSAAEELRKLAEALTDRLAGTPVQGAVQHLIAQARAAVEPVVERNPAVFAHLATAGSELLAAYREAVEGHERRWSNRDDGGESSSSEHIDLD